MPARFLGGGGSVPSEVTAGVAIEDLQVGVLFLKASRVETEAEDEEVDEQERAAVVRPLGTYTQVPCWDSRRVGAVMS